MRISDWSSDVCSSDLRQLHAAVARCLGTRDAERIDAATDLALVAHDAVERGGVEVDLLRRGRAGGRRRGQRCATQRQRIVPDLGELRGIEIGRASGRERGGQYV